MDKDGILDPNVMTPRLPARTLGEHRRWWHKWASCVKWRIKRQGQADELDGIIVACSNLPRAYPGDWNSAFYRHDWRICHDMNVACSAATFGIAQAVGSIQAGLGKRMAVVNVEITSAHLNWRNRDSHFIFGDVATASIIEACGKDSGREPKGSRLSTANCLPSFLPTLKMSLVS